MQHEVNEFMEYVKNELARGVDDWEQRLSTALVKSSPTDLVRATQPRCAGQPESDDQRRAAETADRSATIRRTTRST